MNAESVSLIVNAGGQSRRMGVAKALLPMPPQDTPLIVHIIRRLAPLVTGQVIVVTNDTEIAEAAHTAGAVLTLGDCWEQGGALGGVATGLGACKEWAMVVACDMPLVDPTLFATLIALARTEPMLDAVIPKVGGQAQPFHGLWHPRALPMLEAKLAVGELQVLGALSALRVAWVDEARLEIDAKALAFWNVNTPQEWHDLLAQWKQQNRPTAC